MPSVSVKQEKLMRAVAYSKKFADKVGIPQSVGEEFNDADQIKNKKKKPSRESRPKYERLYK